MHNYDNGFVCTRALRANPAKKATLESELSWITDLNTVVGCMKVFLSIGQLVWQSPCRDIFKSCTLVPVCVAEKRHTWEVVMEGIILFLLRIPSNYISEESFKLLQIGNGFPLNAFLIMQWIFRNIVWTVTSAKECGCLFWSICISFLCGRNFTSTCEKIPFSCFQSALRSSQRCDLRIASPQLKRFSNRAVQNLFLYMNRGCHLVAGFVIFMLFAYFTVL